MRPPLSLCRISSCRMLKAGKLMELDKLIERLIAARDIAIQNSYTVEGDRCVCQKERDEMDAERAELTAVVGDVIKRLRWPHEAAFDGTGE